MKTMYDRYSHWILGAVAALLVGWGTGCAGFMFTDDEGLTQEEALVQAQNKIDSYIEENERIRGYLEDANNTVETLQDTLVSAQADLEALQDADPDADYSSMIEKISDISEDIGKAETWVGSLEGVLEANDESLQKIKSKVEAGDVSGLGVDTSAIAGTAGAVAPLLPPPWNILVTSLAGIIVTASERKRSKTAGQRNQIIMGLEDYFSNGGASNDQLRKHLDKFQDNDTKDAVKKLRKVVARPATPTS